MESEPVMPDMLAGVTAAGRGRVLELLEELLDAHLDTMHMLLDASDARAERMHVAYLQDLYRACQETLARLAA
jgi:hypothetical protein